MQEPRERRKKKLVSKGESVTRQAANSSAEIYGGLFSYTQKEPRERTTNTSQESSSSSGQLLFSSQQGEVCDETGEQQENQEKLDRLVKNTSAKTQEYVRAEIVRVFEEIGEVLKQETLDRLVENTSSKMQAGDGRVCCKCRRGQDGCVMGGCCPQKAEKERRAIEKKRAERVKNGLPIHGCSKCRDNPSGCRECRRD
jgi:predicted DNA-binding protein